jgi:mono/diheme cytochrome c family protein
MFRKSLLAVLIITALLLAACGGSSPAATTTPASLGDAVAGETLFQQSCAACHGVDGTGVPGLGKDLVHSDFVAGLTDTQLVDFIKQGRPVSDPANTTGIDMPPKGGNPALSDAQIQDIVAYMRTIHE